MDNGGRCMFLSVSLSGLPQLITVSTLPRPALLRQSFHYPTLKCGHVDAEVDCSILIFSSLENCPCYDRCSPFTCYFWSHNGCVQVYTNKFEMRNFISQCITSYWLNRSRSSLCSDSVMRRMTVRQMEKNICQGLPGLVVSLRSVNPLLL